MRITKNNEEDLTPQHVFKGIWMPAEIYLHEHLNWPEKFMLVEIDGLDKGDGCYASNAHFSKHLRINETNVSRMISKLARLGFIKIEHEFKPGTKQVVKRFLKSVFSIKAFDPLPVVENSKGVVVENSKGVVVENSKQKDTYIIKNTNIKLNTRESINNINYIAPVRSSQNLSPELLKFKESFPKKVIDCDWPSSLSIDKLISAINESDFLKSDETLNLTLKWYVKNYDKVVGNKEKGITPRWKRFSTTSNSNNQIQHFGRGKGHSYTAEEFNSFFDSIEDIEI